MPCEHVQLCCTGMKYIILVAFYSRHHKASAQYYRQRLAYVLGSCVFVMYMYTPMKFAHIILWLWIDWINFMVRPYVV